MKELLQEDRFNYISQTDKEFICKFDTELTKLGYNYGDKIGSGFCWAPYMIVYTKTGVKSKKVVARFYLRNEGIVLRLFFSKIDKHRAFIENAPTYIKEIFVGDYANCNHCGNDAEGSCMFRKTYTIDDRLIEKCNGRTFEFYNLTLEKLDDYLNLFTEFYPGNKR